MFKSINKLETDHPVGVNLTLAIVSIVATVFYFVVGALGLFFDSTLWDIFTIAISAFAWLYSIISFRMLWKQYKNPHHTCFATIMYFLAGVVLFLLALFATVRLKNVALWTGDFIASYARLASVIAFAIIFIQSAIEAVLLLQKGK